MAGFVSAIPCKALCLPDISPDSTSPFRQSIPIRQGLDSALRAVAHAATLFSARSCRKDGDAIAAPCVTRRKKKGAVAAPFFQ
ncbi:MAG: hypothetical protein Q4615_10375 [Paracoccus aminovorans]|nr:hypothetical protein [Paracoccus aminovorans]